MIARSSAYAYFLETVVGRLDNVSNKSYVDVEYVDVEEKGARTDTCRMPFMRRRNLLRLPFPLVMVNL